MPSLSTRLAQATLFKAATPSLPFAQINFPRRWKCNLTSCLKNSSAGYKFGDLINSSDRRNRTLHEIRRVVPLGSNCLAIFIGKTASHSGQGKGSNGTSLSLMSDGILTAWIASVKLCERVTLVEGNGECWQGPFLLWTLKAQDSFRATLKRILRRDTDAADADEIWNKAG